MPDETPQDRSDSMEKDLHQLEDHIDEAKEKHAERREAVEGSLEEVAGEPEGEEESLGGDDPAGAGEKDDEGEDSSTDDGGADETGGDETADDESADETDDDDASDKDDTADEDDASKDDGGTEDSEDDDGRKAEEVANPT